MKQAVKQFSILAFCAALFVPASLVAQDNKGKADDSKNNTETEVITITRKGDKSQKTTVEINGDKITVNGKPIEDLKNNDITVRLNKSRNSMKWNDVENIMSKFKESENKAMLGVTTKKTDNGVEIQDVTEGSAAAIAGLKEKDIITKVDDQKISSPDDLANVIGKHKPGDKIKVTFLRDNKEQAVTAELTKWKGLDSFSYRNGNGNQFNLQGLELNLNDLRSKLQNMPKGPDINLWGEGFKFLPGRPMLGLSVQDTEDGKGVKVIDVDDNGNANKAGIKENDLITEIDGKAVNSADEVAKIVKDNKGKNSFMFKILRNGKTQNIEVRIPKKLKTADL